LLSDVRYRNFAMRVHVMQFLLQKSRDPILFATGVISPMGFDTRWVLA